MTWTPVLLMGMAAISFVSMAIGFRELSGSVGIFDALAIRNLVGIAILGSFATMTGRMTSLKPMQMRRHVVRNVFQFLGQYTWVVAVVSLPLATVFALEFSTPLFAAFLAVLVLQERMDRFRLTALLAGTTGIVTIGLSGMMSAGWIVLLPLLAAFLFAASDIVTKRMTELQGSLAIMFWLNVLQAPINLGLADFASWSAIGWDQVVPLLLVCIGGLAGHLCLTGALKRADATFVLPLDFVRLPVVAAVGAAFYGETVTWSLAIGSIILLSGVALNVVGERRKTLRNHL